MLSKTKFFLFLLCISTTAHSRQKNLGSLFTLIKNQITFKKNSTQNPEVITKKNEHNSFFLRCLAGLTLGSVVKSSLGNDFTLNAQELQDKKTISDEPDILDFCYSKAKIIFLQKSLHENPHLKSHFQQQAKEKFEKILEQNHALDTLQILFDADELSNILVENFRVIAQTSAKRLLSDTKESILCSIIKLTAKNINTLEKSITSENFPKETLFINGPFCHFIQKVMQKNCSFKNTIEQVLVTHLPHFAMKLTKYCWGNDQQILNKNFNTLYKPFILENNACFLQSFIHQIATDDTMANVASLLIAEFPTSNFAITIKNYIEQNIRVFFEDTVLRSIVGKSNLIKEIFFKTTEKRIKFNSLLCSEFNSIEDVFNSSDLTTFIITSKCDELLMHYTIQLIQEFESLKSDKDTKFYQNLESFLYYSKLLYPNIAKSLMMKNISITADCLSLSATLWGTLNPRWKYFNNDSKNLAKKLISQSALLEKTTFGPLLINTILENYPDLKEEWLKQSNKNEKNASITTQILRIKHSPCSETLKLEKKNLNQTSLKENIKNQIQSDTYASVCSDECTNQKNESKAGQTFSHLKQFSKQIVREYLDILTAKPSYSLQSTVEVFKHLENFIPDEDIEHFLKKIISKEHELQDTYYTFIHGQRSEYLPCEELHTFLQQTINNRAINKEHLHLHVKKIHNNSENYKEQKKLRKKLLSQGRNTDEDRQNLLFVNWAYFGNTTKIGSSSAHYIVSNNNVGSIQLTTQEVFTLNNLEHLYANYKERLDALQKEFDTLTHYGSCLMLAVPKTTIQKHVYVAAVGGAKRKVVIKDIGETDDIRIIMETLNNHPEDIENIDKIEFCIPMTYDKKGALNPESGIKIYTFNAGDQEKLNDYYDRRNVLFNEIKKDIDRSTSL